MEYSCMVHHLAGVLFGLQNNYIIVQTTIFFESKKEHVMIPHNSNKTSWVIFGPYIILQVYM